MEKTIRLDIGGMTCTNCQNKIEKALQRTAGVVSASVRYHTAAADVVYDEQTVTREELICVIERLGYTVLLEKTPNGARMVRTVCLLAIIVSLYAALQSLGVLNLLAPSQLADTKMGYGMLFVIGLVTSVHCIAMCGGINLSQCLPQKLHSEPDGAGKLAAFRPALAYNLGRVVCYTAVGFVLGLAGFLIGGGAEVGLSVLLQGLLKIAAGLFMVLMGINMLGIFPWLRKFTIRMPKALAQKVGNQKAKATRPFLVGVLNGFMPCGPLQSMWIVALASGDPFSGALSMLLFCLGTVPLMLGLGSIVSALGKKFTSEVMTVGAVLVVVLGLAMLSQGGALSGWLPSDLLLVLVIALCLAGIMLSIPTEKKALKTALRAAALAVVIGAYACWSYQGALLQNSPAEERSVEIVDGVQVLSSTLQPGSYPNITVQSGIPVKWVIDAPEGSINGCNKTLVIQDYGISYTFHAGENVIEFTPTETGTVRYSCWMGMIHGNIFVIDGNGDGSDVSADEGGVPTAAGYTIPTETIAIASPATDEYGNAMQAVGVALTDTGFAPAVIVVQRDLPVYWNIDNSMTDAENGTELLAACYSTRLVLGPEQNLLRLYPAESFDVSTGDNRFYCYIKVVDDLSAVDEAAIRQEVEAYEPLIYPPEIFESAGMSCCG